MQPRPFPTASPPLTMPCRPLRGRNPLSLRPRRRHRQDLHRRHHPLSMGPKLLLHHPKYLRKLPTPMLAEVEEREKEREGHRRHPIFRAPTPRPPTIATQMAVELWNPTERWPAC